jgi:SpoVK/Ycf46/Vps4 family AAA+-type ATPase
VGETEKNIRQAFIEAEKDGAILFLDEADSFLGSRENAQRSWEITEVNEILTQMEAFRGMLICATNFRRIVDSAAIRRFAFKLEFDYLTTNGIFLLYETLLAGLPTDPLQATDLARLESLHNVAPGDFKVVYQTHSFFNRADLSHAMLIQALAAEVRAREEKEGVKVGFKVFS